MILLLVPSLSSIPWAGICLILSLGCLLAATFGASWKRVSFGWLGMFFYVLAVALS